VRAVAWCGKLVQPCGPCDWARYRDQLSCTQIYNKYTIYVYIYIYMLNSDKMCVKVSAYMNYSELANIAL
jgi:hypothetical protein